MGAWASKRQRPCANMDNARSLEQSCVDHTFTKNRAWVVFKILAKTRQTPGQLPPSKQRRDNLRIGSQSCFSHGPGDTDNLSYNLGVLLVSQSLWSLILR